MKRKIMLVSALLASFTFTTSPAEAATTTITPRVWHVYTNDAVKHLVGLADTYTACSSKPVDEIYLKVRVRNAHKGRSFREMWFLNGVKQVARTDTWNRNGDFLDFFGYVPGG